MGWEWGVGSRGVGEGAGNGVGMGSGEQGGGGGGRGGGGLQQEDVHEGGTMAFCARPFCNPRTRSAMDRIIISVHAFCCVTGSSGHGCSRREQF